MVLDNNVRIMFFITSVCPKSTPCLARCGWRKRSYALRFGCFLFLLFKEALFLSCLFIVYFTTSHRWNVPYQVNTNCSCFRTSTLQVKIIIHGYYHQVFVIHCTKWGNYSMNLIYSYLMNHRPSNAYWNSNWKLHIYPYIIFIS